MRFSRSLSPRLPFCSLAFGLLLSYPVSAQSPGEADANDPAQQKPSTLDTVEVQGRTEGYVAERTSVMETDTPLNEVPQSISIISHEQIRDQNAQTMQEVLRYTAGVRSDTYGLDNRGDWFTLRGGSEGSTLLDGLRLPLSGWWGVLRNEPFAFERIEVLRGPASVIAGQNGPGGVVNLVSKRPQAEAQREINVQYGNDNHRQIAIDLTGPLNETGTLQYRLVALDKDSDTQVRHASEKRSFLAPSVSWQPTESTKLTIYGEYQKDTSGNTQGYFPLEGTLYPAPHGRIPYHTFIGEPDWDTYGGERVRAGYEFEQELNENWTLRHHLRQDRINGGLRGMYAAWWDGFVDADGMSDPNGTYLNRIWFATSDKSRATNGDLSVEGKLDFGSTRHTLLFGVDGMRFDNDIANLEDTATPLDVYSPVYGSFPLPVLDFAPADRYGARQFGIVAQDQMKFAERWIAVVGLRHDQAKTFTNGVSDTDDSAWSKNFGLVYLADGGWSPYLSYAESFEAVAGADAEGNGFKPKRGKQAEAGLKWMPGDGRFVATAAAYRLKEKNRLTTDPDNILYSIQRGEVDVNGLELEATANLEAWDLVANYTYTDAKQTKLSEEDARYQGKQLFSIPKHSAAVWAVHKFHALPGLRAGLGVRYVGETWDGTDTTRTPSNTLFDALVSYEQGPWRFALNASNLTNKTYIATCLERGDCWFGTKRKMIGTISYRW